MIIILLVLNVLITIDSEYHYYDCVDNSELDIIDINSGDSLLFKRGCRFQLKNQILLDNLNDVIISDYGDLNEDMPILDGSIEFNKDDLVFVNENMYYVSLENDNVNEIKQVFVNEEYYLISHWPRNGSYLPISQTSDDQTELDILYSEVSTYLDDNEPTIEIEDLIGSRVQIRARRYSMHVSDVISHSTNPNEHLVLKGEVISRYNFQKNYGFVFLNKLWMLNNSNNVNGEWVYDNQTKRVYINLKNNDIDNLNSVLINIIPNNGYYAVKAYYSNNVMIKNINFKYCEYGVHMLNSDNFTIEGCEFNKISQRAIVSVSSIAYSHYEYTIFRNKFRDIGIRAISCQFCCNISGNEINNVFVNPYMLFQDEDSGGGVGYGIYFRSHYHCSFIKNNIVNNTGYANIIGHDNGSFVENNYLLNSCLWIDDGCGIHVDGSDHTIRNNIILHGHGSDYLLGTIGSVQGIRPDDGSKNVHISSNFISDFQYGIILHNTMNSEVYSNIIYNVSRYAMYFNGNRACYEDEKCCDNENMGHMCHNIVKNNIFNSNNPLYPVIKVRGYKGIDVGEIDNNYYMGYSKNDLFEVLNGSVTIGYPNLAEWNLGTSFDMNSKFISDFYEIFTDEIYLRNESIVQNGNFCNNISYWDDCSGYVGIEAIFNEEKQCLEGINSKEEKSGYDMITRYSPSFPIVKGEVYMINFSVSASQNDRISFLVKMNESPNFGDVGFYQKIDVTTEMKNYSFVFETTTSFPVCTFHVRDSTPVNQNITMHYYLDNLSLEPIYGILSNKDDDFTIFINPSSKKEVIEFGDMKYCDIEMNIIQDSITLQPFETKFLLNCFCNNDHVCNNNENANSCPRGNLNLLFTINYKCLDCDPYCGNKVCENGENYSNCPSDCDKNDFNDIIIYIIIIGSVVGCFFIILLIVSFVVIFYFQKRKKMIIDENADDGLIIELNQFK